MKKTLYFQNCLGVFQGGGCRGGAFVGAYKEAMKRGVFFSQLAGTSVGSIIAVLIASGASCDELIDLLKKLDFNKFKRPPQKDKNFSENFLVKNFLRIKPKYYNVYNYLGAYSSVYVAEWIDSFLRKKLNKNEAVLFKDLIIPTSVISTDLRNSRVKIWDSFSTPEYEVGKAIQASCSIPFYFQPVDNRYIDGGVLSNLPFFVYDEKSHFDKILAFELENNSKDCEINNFSSFLKSLANTIINGAVNLQLKFHKNIYTLKINTGHIVATDFDKVTDSDVDFLIAQGEKSAKAFFDNESYYMTRMRHRDDVNKDYFQTYNLLALTTKKEVQEVLISDIDTRWVYELFPTILYWARSKSIITVVLKENNDDRVHGPYRQRFLKALGINVKIVQDIPFSGFVFNSNTAENSFAIILNEEKANYNYFDSKHYHGHEDSRIISLLRLSFKNCFHDDFTKINSPIVQECDEDELFEKLAQVPQYSSSKVKFSLIEINISDLILMTNQVRGFKYRQIESLFDAYNEHEIQLFKPSKLIFNGGETHITPPVVEKHGDSYIVVEGNTRVTYCCKNNITKIIVVLVEGVTEFLPSTGRFNASEMLISDKEVKGGNRYNNFDYNLFRKIEKTVRNPQTCLK